MKKKRIVFAITNDLRFDQRMQRICSSLAGNGFSVLLVGRNTQPHIPLPAQPYQQKQLQCLFKRSFFFYAEYNIRLLLFLLFTKMDLLCAIDLDTIIPCYIVSVCRRKQRVYDAHEFFTEQKEVKSRPLVHAVWMFIEKTFVPVFPQGYTVNESLSQEFFKRYGVQYKVIRNVPKLTHLPSSKQIHKNFIIYQGAVNEGRCFETLIPAMKHINCCLLICGKGNFYKQVQQLIIQHKVEDKVILKGYVLPQELKQLTPQACFGITLFEQEGMNQYYSLCNRFFDYIMAGIPQICVAYPEYEAINKQYDVAYLISNTQEQTIVQACNTLLTQKELYYKLKENCLKARLQLNWEEEEKKLLSFYAQLSV